MTTSVAGRLAGYSTQQVRDLERLGVVPAAPRSSSGYRRYQQRHVVALRAYRALAAAIGPVQARRLMPTLLAAPIDEVADAIDNLHADIARDRALVREARRGVDAVIADTTDSFDERDTMTIGDLADALDIRASALRHWEHAGLVHPDRAVPSGSRRYDARAITEARIVAALRSGGYPIPPIARILTQIREEGLTNEAKSLLDKRLAALTRQSVALLEAAGHLHALLSFGATAESAPAR